MGTVSLVEEILHIFPLGHVGKVANVYPSALCKG